MKILHLDSGIGMRGGQWQVLYLMGGLRERGHTVRLLARDGGELFVRAASQGFDVQALGAMALAREHGRYDLIHAHDARSHTLGAALCPGRLIVARRVAFPVRAGVLSRWKYRRARHFIAISKFVAEQLFAAGVGEQRVSVVYDGVPLPSHPAIAPAGPILAVDSPDPMKGTSLAKAAAAAAAVEVRFTKSLAGDLSRASALLYLTHSEGLGSGVLLAMAHGLPVIASRTGGLVEAVENEVTGILVDNDVAPAAAALKRLVSDPALAKRLGDAGRRAAGQRFSVDSMVEGTLAVYRKMLG